MDGRKGLILKRSFNYASDVIKTYKVISVSAKEYVISKQFLRCGTAVGALVREAQNAESLADFIHKMAIAQKECDESRYWLDLLFDNKYISQDVYNSLHDEATSILK